MQADVTQRTLGISDKLWRHGIVWGLIAIAIVIPFSVEAYQTYQYTMALAYAIAIMGLGLLTGINGQFSIGHGAFIALGGYTAGVMINQWGISSYLTIPAAGVICFVAGTLFGITTLRLNFVGLTLTTLALALATPQLLKSRHFEKWTGGVQGIYLDRPEISAWIPLSKDQLWYFITFALLLILYRVASNLVKSRSGRALIAIRDYSIAASSMGINTNLYKSLTFGISALYTGIAGAVMAILQDFIAPGQFDFSFSISLIIGLVIGGLGSIPGAVFGGIFLQVFPLGSILKSGYIGGGILILAVYFMPKGAAHLASQIISHLKSKSRRDA